MKKILGNRKLKFALIGLACLMLSAGVIGFVAVPTFAPQLLGGISAEAAKAEAGSTPVVPTPTVAPHETAYKPTVTIKDRIVNLADPGGRRYLRASIAIEFYPEEEEFQKAMKGSPEERKKKLAAWQEDMKLKAPIIEDAVTSILSSKTFVEVATPEGKASIKAEIKDRVSEELPQDHITNIYITDFVVQ